MAGDSTGNMTAAPVVRIELLSHFAVFIDGRLVDDRLWGKRHAAALVKALALAPGRRLHREQVIDLVWPDDTVESALPKLHKAAHYARSALELPNSVMLRGEHIALCPPAETVIDVVEFEALARRAIANTDAITARDALRLYRGQLLPRDLYEPWAEERREHLRLRYLDLLRLDGRWEDVIELDGSDEAAHVALMRRHVANGDRYAALRQFERLDRNMRRELGVAPGREAAALRDRLIAGQDLKPRIDNTFVGRTAEMSVVGQALLDCASGQSRTVIVVGSPGMGKSSLLSAIALRALSLNFRVGQGTSAPVEGAWPYAPVVEALADLCRSHPTLLDGLADHHHDEIDHALAGAEASWNGDSSHQRLFVAVAELVRLASATTGLLLTIDDVHDADDASLRLLHYVARSTRNHRVFFVLAHRAVALADPLIETRQSLLTRHGAFEMELGPMSEDECLEMIRKHIAHPTSELVDGIVDLSRRTPFAVNELARRAATEPTWVRALDANMIGGLSAATREVLQRVAVVGSSFDTDEFVALSGLAEVDALDHLDIALETSIVEPATSGYRFRHAIVRDSLLDDLPPHRRRRIHLDASARLTDLNASPARIGHHLLAAGSSADAVPYLLRAAETHAALGAYRDALTIIDSVRPHSTGADRAITLSLRADLLNAIGHPMATSAYREALHGVVDPARIRCLRARLARSAVMSGDLETAIPRSTDSTRTEDPTMPTSCWRGAISPSSHPIYLEHRPLPRRPARSFSPDRTTGRCSTSSHCGDCSPINQAAGSIAFASSSGAPARTQRSRTPSSMDTCVLRNTCSTAPPPMSR